ncbi:MAG: dihydropteroate synthase, partial [Muribaculaceae bacterium]|nr:dihydropteroate synthase [Muribaculaceae bacterium]
MMLDVNMDDSMLDASSTMIKFASLLTSDARTAQVPLMIDSSDFDVISSALPLLPLKGIVNSISLKNGEEEFIRRARHIYEMGFDMVVMGFDEKGQADTLERRIEIFSRAYDLLTTSGIPATAIVFDPNVLAVATGIEAHSRYALDFLDSVSWIKETLPGVRVSGGISNLSFAFRGIDPVRKAMHSIFLELAIARGMDMAIINPATPLDSNWIEPELKELITDLFLCKRDDATDRLLAYAVDLKKKLDEEKAKRGEPVKKKDASDAVMGEQSACQMLSGMVLSGDSTHIAEILPLAVDECDGSAMRVVEQALMKGMDSVGSSFSAGSIFLPQVVRSADVMKKAVNILTPLLEQEQQGNDTNGEGAARQKVVLATVKGDVHDIGKNIVSIVLRCSGFEVIDLGVMTPPDKIIDTAVA